MFQKKRDPNFKKKVRSQNFLLFFEITAKCCDPLFFAKVLQNFFRKKKIGHSRMSKKKNLKILLQQNFAKTPKNHLFTLEFSVILYFFYKNLYFKGVKINLKIQLKTQKTGTPEN